MIPTAALLGVALPLYLAALHGWLLLHRRRERVHGGLAAAAGAVAALAASGLLPPAAAAGLAVPLCLGSAVLVRRFVRAMAAAERMATEQAECVARRARELRARDLRLAEGQPLASLGALAASVGKATLQPLGALERGLARVRDAWHTPGAERTVPQALAACRRHVEQLRAIVSRVLAVARHGDRVVERVDLRESVREVLTLVEPLAYGRVRLAADLQEVPPVRGDVRLLGQVVLQLALNAVQAVAPREDGLPAGDVRIALRQAGASIELRVEDTGPGLPADVLPRVFDPFFEPDDGSPGPALSLAVVHRIVAGHGGSVELASGPEGTRVCVRLPQQGPGAAPGRVPSLSPAPAR